MQMHIERSITVAKPPVALFNIISDLKQWNIWSPWVHCEPTSKTEVTGNAGQSGQV